MHKQRHADSRYKAALFRSRLVMSPFSEDGKNYDDVNRIPADRRSSSSNSGEGEDSSEGEDQVSESASQGPPEEEEGESQQDTMALSAVNMAKLNIQNYLARIQGEETTITVQAVFRCLDEAQKDHGVTLVEAIATNILALILGIFSNQCGDPMWEQLWKQMLKALNVARSTFEMSYRVLLGELSSCL